MFEKENDFIIKKLEEKYDDEIKVNTFDLFDTINQYKSEDNNTRVCILYMRYHEERKKRKNEKYIPAVNAMTNHTGFYVPKDLKNTQVFDYVNEIL